MSAHGAKIVIVSYDFGGRRWTSVAQAGAKVNAAKSKVKAAIASEYPDTEIEFFDRNFRFENFYVNGDVRAI